MKNVCDICNFNKEPVCIYSGYVCDAVKDAYQHGRDDVIEEFLKYCNEAKTCLTEYTMTMKDIRAILEQMKGAENE